MADFDLRCLPDRIDREVDTVLNAIGADIDPANVPVQYEWHGDDRLERVSLGAAVGRDIRLPARYANREVEDAVDRRYRNSWTVVDDRDPVTIG